jgi:hypothetical protein
MNDINGWFLIATFDYRYVLPCSGAQGSTGHTTSELLAKVPLFVGGTQWHDVTWEGSGFPKWPRRQTWQLPSGYVKIAIEHGHRNSGFSHWKWWIFPSFFVCLPGRVSTVQSSGVTFSPVQTVFLQRLKSGVHFNGEAAAMGASRPRQQEDGDLKSVKPGCECLMKENLRICRYFKVSIYLGVAIIVISWE